MGNGAGQAATIITGPKSGTHQLVSVAAGSTATFAQLEMTGGGDSSTTGGGLTNSGMTTLKNVTVTKNASAAGGGLTNAKKAILALVDSTASANNAANGGFSRAGGVGGGIFNAGTLTLTRSSITGNVAGAGAGVGGGAGGNGGGLYSGAGSATLRGVTLSSNSSGAGGSAPVVDPGCLLPGSGGDGGGIYSAATLAVTDATVSGNATGAGGSYAPPCAGSAPAGVGGGLAAAGGSAVLSYVTVADNSDGVDNLAGTITAGGTIVADSTGTNRTGAVSETSGYNLDSGTTCAFSAATDISGTEPLLGPLATNGSPTTTRSLLVGSPAIDHGGTVAGGCPTTDQRGDSRPDEAGDAGACDTGAFESQA